MIPNNMQDAKATAERLLAQNFDVFYKKEQLLNNYLAVLSNPKKQNISRHKNKLAYHIDHEERDALRSMIGIYAQSRKNQKQIQKNVKAFFGKKPSNHALELLQEASSVYKSLLEIWDHVISQARELKNNNHEKFMEYWKKELDESDKINKIIDKHKRADGAIANVFGMKSIEEGANRNKKPKRLNLLRAVAVAALVIVSVACGQSRLDKIDTSDMEMMRGANTKVTEQYEQSTRLFNDGKYDEAIRILEQVISESETNDYKAMKKLAELKKEEISVKKDKEILIDIDRQVEKKLGELVSRYNEYQRLTEVDKRKKAFKDLQVLINSIKKLLADMEKIIEKHKTLFMVDSNFRLYHRHYKKKVEELEDIYNKLTKPDVDG